MCRFLYHNLNICIYESMSASCTPSQNYNNNVTYLASCNQHLFLLLEKVAE